MGAWRIAEMDGPGRDKEGTNGVAHKGDRCRAAARHRSRVVIAGATMASLSLVLAMGVTTGVGASQHSESHAVVHKTPTRVQLLRALSALEKHPRFSPPGPPLDAKRLPPSTEVVVIDNVPEVSALQHEADGVIAAAKAAGVRTKLLNGGANNTPSADIDLLEQGVNLHPAVVLQVGIITALETAGLRYAKAHHVPVIAVGDNEPVAGAPGEGSGPLVAGTQGPNTTAAGKAMAEYVAAHGPANATIGIMTADDIVPSREIYHGFMSELHRLCARCSEVTKNVDTADWTTEITPSVTSMLDSHPDMNYLFITEDGMVPWVAPALTARARRPKTLAVAGSPGAPMAAVKSGLLSAEAGASPTLTAWYAFDAALRVMMKLPKQSHPREPVTFFTTPEMRARHLNPKSATSLYGNSFKAGFRRLWGLG